MSTRKILISQLRKGMFIHELDISWIKSPFLRHRRKISADNDILLLRKAGVKELYIDLDRGCDLEKNKEGQQAPVSEEKIAESAAVSEPLKEAEKPLATSTTKTNTKKVPLSEELEVTKVLQGKIGKLVANLSALVKDNRAISTESINPVITEARESLARNDQALLTMLHLHRQDVKLSDHGFGVFALVLPLAIRMKCTEEEINELGMAALLHDTGWSRLPINLLGKNRAYTPAEIALIQQHPSIVESVLKNSNDFPENVIALVKQHHENNKGTGYPDKLTKDSLHKRLNLLQVADCYDEYVHGLTDKPGMLPVNALKKIYQAASKGLYDQLVVKELIHTLGIYPLTSAVYLSSGEKAIVIEVDKQKPLLPRVRIVYEADGSPSYSERIVDLADPKGENDIKVVKAIDTDDRKEDPQGLLLVKQAEVF